MNTKRCARCGHEKPHQEFYRNAHWPDGFHPWCKPCQRAYYKARRDAKRETAPGRFRWQRDLVVHGYFSQVDSQTKAYVLGVLAADGNIFTRTREGGVLEHRVALELAAKDADLVYLVRDQLVPGGTVRSRIRREREYLVLAFDSEQMVSDLAALSITPAKSRTLTWPATLPECYERAFILGFFDGDGHVTWHQRENGLYPYLGIVSGSSEFLASVVSKVEEHTGVHMGGPWLKTRPHTYFIRASGKNAREVDRWLHSDDLGLARKRLA